MVAFNRQSYLFDKNCIEEGKTKTILDILFNSDFNSDLSVIVTSPKNLLFDERSSYCCKLKCPNYGTRCFCPPFSKNLVKKAKSKKYAIILAKTYDYSELTHFQEKPEELNNEYLFKKRVFVRRWVQNNFYSKIKEVFSLWGLNRQEVFAGGFSIKKCIKCFKDETASTKKNCIPLPSPEALGIDVTKSLEKFGYFVKFGFLDKMTKVSMIFTNELNCEKYFNQKYVAVNDKPHKYTYQKQNILNLLKERFPDVHFQEKNTENLKGLKNDYDFLHKWNNVIKWKTSNKNKSKMKNEIHKCVFNANCYFSLDFLSSELLLNKSEEFDGFEFY